MVGELREYVFERIIAFVLNLECACGSLACNVDGAKLDCLGLNDNLRRVDGNALNINLEFSKNYIPERPLRRPVFIRPS